jgi:hypothetical protein
MMEESALSNEVCRENGVPTESDVLDAGGKYTTIGG